MSADLPFVYPAQDPSIETTARARSRVQRLVRRRRAQRRALGSAAFAAFAVVAIAGTIGALTGGDDADVVAEGDLGRRADVDPDTAWSDPVLSEDERTLTIMVGSSPAGDGPCDQNFVHEVIETGESVTVGFERLPGPPASEDVGCPDVSEPQRFDIELSAPLGERQVYNGVRREPQTVHRLAELVDVTTVPDGWTAEEPTIAGSQENGWYWQQTFYNDSADWYFAVSQQPASDAAPQHGTPTPVMVHGIEGVRYTGQMRGTMESISWLEGGVMITVSGEMQGPPTFTHSDELLQIAEGVRLPAQ
jgi:hypothetical protein